MNMNTLNNPITEPASHIKKKIFKYAAFFCLVVILITVISGCKDTSKKPSIPKINRIPVKSQTAEESRLIKQTLTFPALITAKEEAKILAKSSGTAKEVFFNIGETVKAGDILIKTDDVSGTSYGTDFNAGPINQAKLASEQAGVMYNSASAAYQNLLASTDKDLNQAQIALSQAQTTKGNTMDMTNDSIKTAQIAYDTAKIAAEQAKEALDNRNASADQSESDVNTNSGLAATAVINTGNTIITGINMLTGFDESHTIVVPYDNYLGAKNGIQLNDAKNLYKDTKSYYQDFLRKNFTDESDKVAEAVLLAEQIKKLTDAIKLVFDNTVTGSALPQSSATGQSLSGLQSAIAGYQTQINSALTQIQSASQALTNTGLNNNSSLDALQKGYELAQQQEKAALQNLENLKTSSKNQLDLAGFGENQANNMYEDTKIKLDSQLVASKAQLDNAKIQYENSLINLNNLTSSYQLISPIDGEVTEKFISTGETVAPGQLLFVISKPESVKMQFYVDSSALPFMEIGLPVAFQNTDNQSFTGKVTAISSSADDVTKRFLVEAEPDEKTDGFAPGTITDAILSINIKPENTSDILLPISAVDVGQNGSSIFLDDNGRAKKIDASVIQIKGESAEIKADIPEGMLIVVDGNRLLHDGDFLTEQQ
jgi:RND family efflux transporter MFP subunit